MTIKEDLFQTFLQEYTGEVGEEVKRLIRSLDYDVNSLKDLPNRELNIRALYDRISELMAAQVILGKEAPEAPQIQEMKKSCGSSPIDRLLLLRENGVGIDKINRFLNTEEGEIDVWSNALLLISSARSHAFAAFQLGHVVNVGFWGLPDSEIDPHEFDIRIAQHKQEATEAHKQAISVLNTYYNPETMPECVDV